MGVKETSFALRRRSWIFLLQASLFSCSFFFVFGGFGHCNKNRAGDTQGEIFSRLNAFSFLFLLVEESC